METVRLTTGYHDYWRLPTWVWEHGERRAPRGRPTFDAGPVTLIIESPDTALALNCGRGLSPRVAAVETLQLIGAFSDPALTTWASESFREFTEDDGSFHGAYGRRIGEQLSDVFVKLRVDPATRQAIITLWDPFLDNVIEKRDYPCTVGMGFRIVDRIRDGVRPCPELELNVVMRSNDVWLGTPYDIFQFTQLQLTLATMLGIKAGRYRHTAWSLHLYEEHVPLLEQLHAPTGQSYQPGGLAQPGDLPDDVILRAGSICYAPKEDLLQLGESACWFRDRVAPWVRKVNGDEADVG